MTVWSQVEYEGKTEVLLPEQIVGALLGKCKRIAELGPRITCKPNIPDFSRCFAGLDGTKVADAVIGVPAWWTDHQRRALLDAANIAGLNGELLLVHARSLSRSVHGAVLRLVAENTLVALNYQFSRMTRMDAKERESGKEIRVLFIDVGHTRFALLLLLTRCTHCLALAAVQHQRELGVVRWPQSASAVDGDGPQPRWPRL